MGQLPEDTSERMVVMEQQRRRWLIPLLSVAFIASLFWGFQQYQAHRSWEIRTENQYNRAFSELSAHVNGLESQLAKAMVSNSPPILMRYFSDIWRGAYMSQEDLGQLPLASMELANTKNFLAKVGAYTYDMAVRRDLRQRPLSEKEWQTLKDLRQQAQHISTSLLSLQEDMLDQGDRWLDVDRVDVRGLTTAAGNRRADLENNKVTKSFMMLEDGLKRLPDPDFEGNMLNFKEKPRGLTGDQVTVEQGRKIAREFIPDSEGLRIRYDGRIRGDMTTYTYTLSDPQDEENSPVRIGVTSKGGHVAWMLKERAVDEGPLTLKQSEERAKAFLASRGYPSMTPVSTEDFANIATVSMACICDGYVVYPDLVKVQVARDNGEVLAVEAIPYLTFHRPGRSFNPPSISKAEAQKKINRHLNIEDLRPAVILDDRFKEVPCWEAIGKLDAQRYRVYINAESGQEEKIQRVNANGVEIE